MVKCSKRGRKKKKEHQMANEKQHQVVLKIEGGREREDKTDITQAEGKKEMAR